MPIPERGVAVGSVPLDALEAGQVADLLSHAAQVIGALAGQADAEALNEQLAPGGRSLTELHLDLALAVADLDEAIDTHTGTL